MKTLVICGSKSPTYCGIGKYANKVINLLPKDEEIIYFTNIEQLDQNLQDQNLIREMQTYVFNLNSLNFGQIKTLWQIVKNHKPDRVIIQHQTFKKNYLDSLFGLITKLANQKTSVFNVIHEFRHFGKLGKLRLLIAGIWSDKILFSDISQAKAFNQISKNIFAHKTKTTLIGNNSNQSALKQFESPNFENLILEIAYHGYIQPAKGVDLLLQALAKFDKPYKLHILGEFKNILDYTGADETAKYQANCLQIIEQNPKLKASTIIHGDIEPSSQIFQDLLRSIELIIFPFLDYLTMRRTSFIGTLMASNAIAVSTFDSQFSDSELAIFGGIKPTADSVLEYLNNYSNLNKTDVSKSQIKIKNTIFSQTAIANRILEDLK